jgi:hypothetical protein
MDWPTSLTVHRSTTVVALATILAVPAAGADRFRLDQPVHEYFTPFGPDTPAADRNTYGTKFTHLGTDFGAMGSHRWLVAAADGAARVDLRRADGWAGLWHSLAGAGTDRAVALDFARCYPAWILDPYQPRCDGVFVRASGAGRLTLEIKGGDEKILWSAGLDLAAKAQEHRFAVDPTALRAAKFLNWVAGPGTAVAVDALGLQMSLPPMPLADRTFVVAYAKLARCAIPGTGLVKDQGQRPAGAFEGVPASGLYALATAAAADRGLVTRTTAEAVLADALRGITALPTADGWLPHFAVRGPDGKYTRARGTEYGTVDTSLAYHGLLLAAHLLGDRAGEKAVTDAVRRLKFDRVRGPDGHITYGLGPDGKTSLIGGWTEWGGEAALVLLLERMALGDRARPKMNPSGRVPDGVGFVAELQSLFYPQFDSPRPDAVTGKSWPEVRRALAAAQAAAVVREAKAAPAAKLGLFGQSAGEGYRGRGYLADGLRTPPTVLHPHYALMAGLSAESRAPTWDRLGKLEAAGLMPPWGLVENVTADLAEYLPTPVSLNAAFECLAAYHLAVAETKAPNRIHDAARSCPATAAAIRLFYP